MNRSALRDVWLLFSGHRYRMRLLRGAVIVAAAIITAQRTGVLSASIVGGLTVAVAAWLAAFSVVLALAAKQFILACSDIVTADQERADVTTRIAIWSSMRTAAARVVISVASLVIAANGLLPSGGKISQAWIVILFLLYAITTAAAMVADDRDQTMMMRLLRQRRREREANGG